MKVDEFGRILDETVHFGHKKVDLYTILDIYEGLRLSNGYMNRHLHMMQDLFCLPEATLLADVCVAAELLPIRNPIARSSLAQ